MEAAYWAERGALRLPGGLAELLARFPDTLTGLAVYRDLKERGLVVKPAPAGFRLYDRDSDPRGAAPALVRVMEARQPVVFSELAAALAPPQRFQLGVVDGDGDVTHYRVDQHAWEEGGYLVPAGKWRGEAHGPLVRVTGGEPLLLRGAGIGRAIASDYWLTPLEAWWLCEGGLLELIGETAVDETLYATYRHLRYRGYRVGSGFKFGTHFRIYRRNDHHAAWLVLVPPDRMAWSDLARAVRVAHGVHKRLVLHSGGKWLAVEWIRP